MQRTERDAEARGGRVCFGAARQRRRVSRTRGASRSRNRTGGVRELTRRLAGWAAGARKPKKETPRRELAAGSKGRTRSRWGAWVGGGAIALGVAGAPGEGATHAVLGARQGARRVPRPNQGARIGRSGDRRRVWGPRRASPSRWGFILECRGRPWGAAVPAPSAPAMQWMSGNADRTDHTNFGGPLRIVGYLHTSTRGGPARCRAARPRPVSRGRGTQPRAAVCHSRRR